MGNERLTSFSWMKSSAFLEIRSDVSPAGPNLNPIGVATSARTELFSGYVFDILVYCAVYPCLEFCRRLDMSL